MNLFQGTGSHFSGGSLTCGFALGFVVYPICVLPRGWWSSDLNNVLTEYRVMFLDFMKLMSHIPFIHKVVS